MKYLMLMSISGSGLFAGYLCWERLFGKSITQCMKYRALIVVMLVYAIPWIWLKGTYRWMLTFLWRTDAVTAAKGIVNIADIKTEESVYQTKEYRVWMVMLAIWFAIAIGILLFRLTRYLVKRNALRGLAIQCGDKNLEKTMTCLRESCRYKCNPEVVWTRVNNEAFTLGTIKPVIFLQKEYAEKELYWILKHEMTHIVRKDLWIKLFLEFVCCLHWFNPCIYLLERKMRFLCEASCDEYVIRGCTEDGRRTYMELLDGNKVGNWMRVPFNSAQDDSSREIEKRIALMKKRRNVRIREKIVVVCAFGLLVFLDSLMALAYPKVYHIKLSATEAAKDTVDGGNFWVDNYVEDGYGTFLDTILYDEQFVGEDNHIYPVDSNNITEECFSHDEVIGVVEVHVKDSDGGCTIEIYEASRCTKCSMVQKGELLHKARKIPRPH